MAPRIQWPLVLFSLFAGVGGCVFAFAVIANLMGESLRLAMAASIVALALLAIGGFCSMAHLATPRHAVYAIKHIMSFSGISVELIMLGVSGCLMLVYLVLAWRGVAGVALAAIGLAGAVAGVILAFATGHGYLISSKPTWNTRKLPIAYTATSLAGGGFLYLAVASLMSATPSITRVMVVLNAVCVAFSIIAVAVYMNHLGKERSHQDKTLYHVGIVGCGMLVPAIAAVLLMICLNTSPALFALVAFMGVAASLVGGAALRMVMWIVGAGFLSLFEQAQRTRSALMNAAPEMLSR